MDNNPNVNWTLIHEMAEAMTPAEREATEQRIASSGRIPMRTFQITIACLFAVASLGFFSRIGIRLWTRRRIFLDDGLLTFSFACLIVATGIFYERARIYYLVFYLLRGDVEASLIAYQEIDNIYRQMDWSFAYMSMLWTCIFMVKFCYFAFFHTLIQSLSRGLTRFYWTAVAFTLVSWIFLVIQQLISCPYFGSSSSRCFPSLPISDEVLQFTTWIGPILDSLTDIAIISIPIFVLRKSRLSLLNKIGLGVFLCLSFFMLGCSITRAAGTYHNGVLDTPWGVFWLHAESCIGVLMASVTVYRSVLVNSTKVSTAVQKFVDKVLRTRSSNRLPSEPMENLTKRERFGMFLLSRIPNATLTGLGTLFAGTKQTPGTNNMLTVESTFEMTDSDYHTHLKKSQSGPTPATTRANGTACSQEELWRAPSIWAAPDQDTEAQATAVEEEKRPPGRFAAFFLRFFLPPSHRSILQHRSVGDGSLKTVST